MFMQQQHSQSKFSSDSINSYHTAIFTFQLCQMACVFTALLFLIVFMRFLAGWHLFISSGLGTNAQKHSVDSTRSDLIPLGDTSWLLELSHMAGCTVHLCLNLTLNILFIYITAVELYLEFQLMKIYSNLEVFFFLHYSILNMFNPFQEFHFFMPPNLIWSNLWLHEMSSCMSALFKERLENYVKQNMQ